MKESKDNNFDKLEKGTIIRVFEEHPISALVWFGPLLSQADISLTLFDIRSREIKIIPKKNILHIAIDKDTWLDLKKEDKDLINEVIKKYE